MIKRLKIHIQAWKVWNKNCLNKPFYKFLVLIGLAHSPTLEMMKHRKTDPDKEVIL